MAISVWRKAVRLLRGVYPEPEILRYAQNDRKRRARNDRRGLPIILKRRVMRVNLQHTHIFTSDIEATLRFWQDMFGTQILFDTEIAEARQDSLRRAFAFEDTG